MKNTWVVVADEAIARILQRHRSGQKLEPVEELTDPAAHADGSDLRRDAVGRRAASSVPDGGGGAVGHRLRAGAGAVASAGEGQQHQEAEEFARRVAERLGQGLQQGAYEELQIVAAPRFLGLLRKALSPQCAAAVTREVDKDVIHESDADIQRRLFAE